MFVYLSFLLAFRLFLYVFKMNRKVDEVRMEITTLHRDPMKVVRLHGQRNRHHLLAKDEKAMIAGAPSRSHGHHCQRRAEALPATTHSIRIVSTAGQGNRSFVRSSHVAKTPEAHAKMSRLEPSPCRAVCALDHFVCFCANQKTNPFIEVTVNFPFT